MKRTIFIMMVACMAGSLAMAQKECKVLSQEVGSIKFEVDENLPKVETEEKSFYEKSTDALARTLVNSSLPSGYKPEILAYSFAGEKMAYAREDVFFYALVKAYAEHRPFVLSPDMVWQLIGFNFSEYVNNHAEEMRSLLVPHEGVKDLKIMTEEDILGDKNADWSDLFDKFSAEIAKNTKGDIAQLMTSDFSTTGQTERIASQITLMESLKSYFHYIAGRLACGIPYIILKGTPADWRKVAEKVQGLEAYNMGWWTKELNPIIAEFVKTAEGHPDKKFWKNIVMEDRPDRLRGGGCSNEKPTDLDGWIVKLFPDMKKGVMQKTVPQSQMQGVELSEVKFKYQLIDPITMQVLEETDIALYAGFVGVTVDEATGAIEPKIGWIARKVDEEAETLARFKNPSFSMSLADGSGTKIKTVPEVLKRESHYQRLQLTFEDKVVIPEWMDSIQIDDFTIEGYMTDAEQAQLKKRFPKANVKRLLHNTTTRRDLAPGQYAYRLDSIVSTSSSGSTVFRLAYDEQGRISEVIRHFSYDLNPYKSIYHYDERGFCVREDQYEMTYGKDVLTMVREDTYTDEGRLLKKESKWYGEDGKLFRINTVRNTYDQRGNLVEQMDEYKMQRSESVSKSKTTYAYNALNQRIEEIAYGHKTQEDEFFPNITDKMEYDKQGRISHSTAIETTGIGEDYKIETYMEYTEQNGQVVREQCKSNSSRDENWTVEVINRAYDTYGNLVREDREKNDTYSGSTNYYYDLATKAENVQGVGWYDKPGMSLLNWGLLCDACNSKYRVTRINRVNASGDFEGLSGTNTSGSDVRFYYTEIK
ncbi:MAG: DUF4419 domain-containing protein [Bacteroidaceae bacterium]|nr:DUF4419 domain-containing protein [Bacteroidaceae bacterium]